ncbi:hypothetical protein ACFX15_043462 [Malus domestica]
MDEQAAASPSFFTSPPSVFRVGLDARINRASPGRQAPAPRLLPCSMQSSAFLHSSSTSFWASIMSRWSQSPTALHPPSS